ncbi:hypothetical protein A9G43_07690 [Gilliamella sp. Occ3-1]|uniref:glycosyltransferase n=1 Tax=Gilliamella sp. Occ3-1 TaxID=3120253 RepID=UPI00080E3C26|nr:glycosyltransferase [Gilliamella apicola]OCG70614.1 hypothetical protein A9G43_07690 [Gilliamella apicola]
MAFSPILTIIIPVYNTANYLKRCLDSVINQSFQDIEIICINDGSIDNSLHILEEYQKNDGRIRIITKKNEGLSIARNIGIVNAFGKYITFVDSDDFIEINTYELALQYFTFNDIDVVYFSTNLVFENCLSNIEQEKYYNHKYHGITKLTPDVLKSMDVCAWNKIYKREIIDKYNIKFPEGLLYEDNPFFWSYMLVSNKVYFMKEKLYNYTIRENSIMGLTSKRKLKILGKCNNGLDKLLCFEYLMCFILKWHLFHRIEPILCGLFEKNLWDGLYYSSKKSRKKVLQKATELVEKFNLADIYSSDNFITSLSQRKYYKIRNINSLFLNFWQRILGVWKTDKYYIICFFGIKIKVSRVKN